MSKDKLTIKINGENYKLKVTYGFWRNCGFKREDVERLESDAEMFLTALKLALFYGNKQSEGWNNMGDMEKVLTDDVFDEIEEDYTDNVVFATVHYLPANLRKIVLSKMAEAESKIEETMDAELNSIPITDQDDSEKKN